MAKERKSTKRALVASGISILLCVLMLIGTTLAWFTDQASNKGNRIEAGTLELEVIGYDAAGVQVVDFKKETTPLINEINWEPSLTDTKYILVHNKGTIDLKFELSFKSGDAKLAEALWYYFTPVAAFDPGVSADDVLAAFAVSPMQDLVTAGATGALAQGESKLYRLDYGMNPCAGNEYQGLSFLADIHVVATQDKAGAVINGNIIPVFDEADFLAAVAKVNGAETCPTIILMDNIIVDGNVKFTKPFNLDLNGKALMIDGDLELDINQARGTMDFGNKKTGGQILLSGSYTESVTGGIVFNKNVTPIESADFIVITGANPIEGGAKLAAALADGSLAGKTVYLPDAEYSIPKSTTPMALGHWGVQSGWRFPITDSMTIIGSGNTVLTNADPLINGAGANQNFITVTADNVTIKGVTLKPVGPTDGIQDTINKAIEVFGKNFQLIDVEIAPLLFDNGRVYSGNIYFSAADVGAALLQNVSLYAWISAPGATVTAGTITLDSVVNDFRNNDYAGLSAYGVISLNSAFVLGPGKMTVMYDALADYTNQIQARTLDTTNLAGTILVGP